MIQNQSEMNALYKYIWLYLFSIKKNKYSLKNIFYFHFLLISIFLIEMVHSALEWTPLDFCEIYEDAKISSLGNWVVVPLKPRKKDAICGNMNFLSLNF